MKKIIAITLLLVGASFFAHAQTFTAAGDPWPPFYDADHPHFGLASQIVSAALATQGHDVKFLLMPWVRSLKSVYEGDVDMLVDAWDNPERREVMLYSDTFLYNNIKFVKRAGDDFEFNGLESLDGKNVGIITGFSYGEEFLSATNFKRHAVATGDLNLKKLAAGRIDLTLEDEIVIKTMIANDFPALQDKLAFTENHLNQQLMYVTSGKINPNSQLIISAFNKGLAEIKANGTFDKIMQENGIN